MAAAADQEQDRTEPATPFKLREARKRGQVSKSLEINSLLILSAALLVSLFKGEHLAERHLQVSRNILAEAGSWQLDVQVAAAVFDFTASSLVATMWPFFAAVMLTGVLANLTQTGPVFSFFPVKPDFKRLNPVNGFKRLFSKKLLFESFKTFIKMGVFGTIVYLSLLAMLPKLLALNDIDSNAYPVLLLGHGQGLAYKLILAVVLIALLDLLYSRYDYGKQMRMSRREIKEEVKRREGDPQIRARRRQLQREGVKRASAIRRVPDADVLITNPTHLSVAVRYDSDQETAPVVLAKGAGELALKMRVVAGRHRVPIVENKALARELFTAVQLEETIPDSLFPKLARILAWVFLQRESAAPEVS